MWCTSRASPVSMTRPTWVRWPVRTRCWCTAEVSSSDGIGAWSASQSRSDRIRMRAPASMACEHSRRTRSIAAASASPPPNTRYRPSISAHWKPGRSPSALTCQILASSSLSITGRGSTICRHDAGPGSSRLCSGPDRAGQRGHHLLADRVQRRVGDLREQLGEVVEEQPRPLRQRGQRGVGAHRAERLDAAGRPSARAGSAAPPRCSRRSAGGG